MTNPFLEPVAKVWTRLAGIALLLAGSGPTAGLVYALFEFTSHAELRRHLTSSSVIFALILLALCGICWQAGYRLAFDRPDRSGTLFSRPAWFAIGTGLIVIAGLMAYVIVSARPPTSVDFQVIVCLAALGAWCFVLAYRRRL